MERVRWPGNTVIANGSALPIAQSAAALAASISLARLEREFPGCRCAPPGLQPGSSALLQRFPVIVVHSPNV
jgi:hypothetical protein